MLNIFRTISHLRTGTVCRRISRTGIGLLAVASLASCGLDENPDTLPTTTESPTHAIPATTVYRDMNRRSTARALLTRSRVNRHGKAPDQTLVRVYDAQGNVKSESAKEGSQWTLRPSTISDELARRSLSSFVVAGAPSLYDTTQTTLQTLTFKAVDTNNDSVHVSDSTSTIPTGLIQSGVLDRVEDTSTSYFDAYYNNVTQLGLVTSGEGAVVLTYVPGEDGYVETQISYWDYQTAAQQFVTDTTAEFAMGSVAIPSQDETPLDGVGRVGLLNASLTNPPSLTSGPCMSGMGLAHHFGSDGRPTVVRVTMRRTTDPCGGEKATLVGAGASLVAWGIGGAFCAFFCQEALPFIGKGAATSAVATIGAASATICCVHHSGGASLQEAAEEDYLYGRSSITSTNLFGRRML